MAYVIYTSGSTGQPKGVVVEHRPRSTTCTAWPGTGSSAPATRAAVRLAHLRRLGDGHVHRPAARRRYGRPRPPRDAALPAPAGRADARGTVTFACLPPAVLNLLAGEQFPDLRVLLSAGEELPASCCEPGCAPAWRSATATAPPKPPSAPPSWSWTRPPLPPPIGLPMPNYQAYVLDPTSARSRRRHRRAAHRRRRRRPRLPQPARADQRSGSSPTRSATTQPRGCTRPATWSAGGPTAPSCSSAGPTTRSRSAACASSWARSRPR